MKTTNKIITIGICFFITGNFINIFGDVRDDDLAIGKSGEITSEVDNENDLKAQDVLNFGKSENKNEFCNFNDENNLKKLQKLKFWKKKLDSSKNEILMKNSEIREYSKKIPQTKGTNCINLDEFPKILSKDELLSEINKIEIPKEPRYIGDLMLGESYYERLLENRNIDLIKDENKVRYGFVVRNTQVKTFPTDDVSYDEVNDIEFDQNCETVLKTWERVLILHTSKDERYYFVKAYNYDGWVKIDDVALATDDQWKKYSYPENFLMVTGDEIKTDIEITKSEQKFILSQSFSMGTKLPLIEDKPEILNNISTLSSYVVELPMRSENGSLEIYNGRIPGCRDVKNGYLKYTSKNILKQLFKTIGRRYGWSDLWESRDCSSLALDVCKTFGFDLPRNGSKQAAVETSEDVSNMGDKEKKEYIMQQPIGTLLYMPGHVMIYIGTHNNEPYILHSTYKFKNETYNCVVVTDLNLIRNNGKTILESINFINNMQKYKCDQD